MNHLTLSGNLVADPEKKDTKGGVTVATGRLAVNYGKDKDPEFFDFTAFDRTAEHLLTHCTSGRAICIEGRIRENKWETDDGEHRKRVELIANSVFFGPVPRAKSAEGASQETPVSGSQSDQKEGVLTF